LREIEDRKRIQQQRHQEMIEKRAARQADQERRKEEIEANRE